MLERFIPALRILCLILAGIAALQAAHLVSRNRVRSDWSNVESLLPNKPVSGAPSNPTVSAAAPSPTNPPDATGAATATNLMNATNAIGPGAATNAGKSVRPPAARRGSGPPNPNADLPAEVQTRIERITQSEVFGPLPRPQPMALLGIAGRDVILRAPDGRTGLVRLGEEFGGVKLLQVGTNRVLVEHEQQRKELTLFSGFGGESLLRNEKKERP